jgi:archaellum component FlaF (FlaF/FlaG flagellin family)
MRSLLQFIKGKSLMDTLIWVIAQLVLVAIVYVVAYKNGYKAAQIWAASTVQEFSEPVNELLDALSRTVDESLESQNEKGPTGL